MKEIHKINANVLKQKRGRCEVSLRGETQRIITFKYDNGRVSAYSNGEKCALPLEYTDFASPEDFYDFINKIKDGHLIVAGLGRWGVGTVLVELASTGHLDVLLTIALAVPTNPEEELRVVEGAQVTIVALLVVQRKERRVLRIAVVEMVAQQMVTYAQETHVVGMLVYLMGIFVAVKLAGEMVAMLSEQYVVLMDVAQRGVLEMGLFVGLTLVVLIFVDRIFLPAVVTPAA